jgi:hypothetical protein
VKKYKGRNVGCGEEGWRWQRLPIIWRTIVLFRNEFVVALDREVVGRDRDADRSKEEDGPASSAQRPREIEMPPVPEAVVVVEEVCLPVLVPLPLPSSTQ